MSEVKPTVIVVLGGERAIVVEKDPKPSIRDVNGLGAVQQLVQRNGSVLVERKPDEGAGKLLARVFPRLSEEAILECLDNHRPTQFVFCKMVLESLRRGIRRETVGDDDG